MIAILIVIGISSIKVIRNKDRQNKRIKEQNESIAAIYEMLKGNKQALLY
jgi:hypothetical protein